MLLREYFFLLKKQHHFSYKKSYVISCNDLNIQRFHLVVFNIHIYMNDKYNTPIQHIDYSKCPVLFYYFIEPRKDAEIDITLMSRIY